MKMTQNKNSIIMLVVFSVAGVSLLAASSILNAPPQVDLSSNYTPSDMSKAFPQLDGVLRGGDASMLTTNIEDVKSLVQYTVRGTVVNIGSFEKWTDPTPQPEELQKIMGQTVKIPVDIKVTQVKKHKSDLKNGDIITVKLLGRLVDNTLYLYPNSPQFEIGEDIIVHVSVDPNDIIEKDFKFVQLGEYGKYKIQDGKAFNLLFPHGKDIEKALDETQ
jgi:hypothetical protein